MEGDFGIDQWLIQPQLNSIVSPDNTTIQVDYVASDMETRA